MAGLHLDRLIQDCRDSVFRNASMWARDEAGQLFDMPHKKLADNLCLNGCSDNGACDRGFCRCQTDFVGSDCSQSVTSRRDDGRSVLLAPPVIALASKGLCDVRKKPCRELVILGDGFVSHESFKCSFEVYQVGSTTDLF